LINQTNQNKKFFIMPIVNNKGRIINQISGIQGVASGGTALINLPVNARYHRLSLNVVAGGSPVAVAVTTVIASVQLLVNGVTVRDWDVANLIKLAYTLGYAPNLGELPIFFTEPVGGNNVNEPPDQLSWDVFGQSTFQLKVKLNGSLTNPGITGTMEFDYLRNAAPVGGVLQPFLMPVIQHQYSAQVVAGKQYITTIPFAFPIRRIYLTGSSAGNISAVEIIQDGQKIFEASLAELKEMYQQYGFDFGRINWLNASWGVSSETAISGKIEQPSYFEAGFISDPDGRHWKALKVGNELKIGITSGAAQTINFIVETLPGQYA
jgi:hypothetical protein